MPGHSHVGPGICPTCGAYENRSGLEDLNVLSFERLKWGGVRHTGPFYQLFDLSEFQKLPAVKSTPGDRAILRAILKAASSQPDDVWCGELEKALSGLFPSSKAERRTLLQILSYCGILAPNGRPGFFRDWPAVRQRAERPVSKIDWTYPIVWWQGRHGSGNDKSTSGQGAMTVAGGTDTIGQRSNTISRAYYPPSDNLLTP
jgi:hypothetical protein